MRRPMHFVYSLPGSCYIRSASTSLRKRSVLRTAGLQDPFITLFPRFIPQPRPVKEQTDIRQSRTSVAATQTRTVAVEDDHWRMFTT
jgi:hypothetical protein